MRKNFLLLFLMALLPLAGWAYDYEVQVTTYDGTATWTGAKPDVQPDWFSASFVGGGAPSAAQKAIIATGLKVKDVDGRVYNAGTYEYQLALKGGQTISDPGTSGDTYKIYLNSSTTATLTINKILTPPTVNATGLAYVDGDLKYDGSAYALLATGATASTNGVEVPVVYATSATAETWYSLADLKETNAGTYTVYYKVAETVNYAGSEPEPMASTKSIAKATTATFNVEAVPDLVFNNGDQALVTKTDAEAPIVPFGLEGLQYQIDGGEWTAFTTLDAITGKSAKNGAAYAVKFKIPESANWNDIESAAINVTIAKATTTFTTEPTFADEFEYDGQAHQLITNPGVAEFGATPSFALRYKRAGANAFGSWITIHGSNWSENYELRTATNAGVYEIAYCTKTTDDLIKADTKYKKITVLQKEIPTDSYTAPAPNENLKANGEAQALITAGSWNVDPALGEFQYKVGEGAWGNTVPEETDADTYTVYSKIVATSNYKDVDLGSVDVTIAAKDQVTIAIPAGQSFGYGTTPTLEYTADWGGNKGGDALDETGLTWSWFSDAAGSNPTTPGAIGDYYVTVSGLAVTGSTSASKEIVYPAAPVLVKITAGQVNASISGEATYGSLPTFTLTHVSGLSESEAAGFDADNNLTTVTVKKDGAVVNELENVDKDDVNLAKLAAGEYDLEATATLANYNVVVAAGKLNVSAKSIDGATITVTTDANAIVYNNKAWGTVNPIDFTVTETSGIEAADYDVTYSNNVIAGTATITLTGKRNYTGNVTKDFTIKKAGLTIKAVDFTGDKAWTYGTTEPTYAVTVEGQAEGETALEVGGTLAGIDGALTVVRTSNETVGMHTGALVAQFGTAQPVESDNYTITYSAGNLQVAKAEGEVVIKLKDKVGSGATYGDKPATHINAAIRNIENYEYVSGLPEAEAANFASIINVSAATYSDLANAHYEVGKDYTFTIAGATSTNYNVTVQNGTYCVGKKSPIVLFAKPQTIDFTNETIDDDAPDTEVSDETVGIDYSDSKPGLKYKSETVKDVVASIVITTTKIGENPITLTAKENGNYDIHLTSGVLTVIGEEETIQFDLDGTDLAKIQSYASPTKAYNVKIKLNRRNVMNEGKANEKVYTWNKYDWNTMVLPFEVTVRELSKAIGYAIVNVYDETNTKASDAGFKVTMGTIPANTPFLLKTDADIADDFYIEFEGKNIVAPTAPMILTAQNGISYIGTYESVVINNENSQGLDEFNPTYYKYYAEDKIKGVGKTSSNKYTAYPFSAFFNWTAPTNSAPEMTITVQDMDGTTTTIRSIETEGKNVTDGLYNLQGVKMQGAPTQKGIYIKDGKKVVIK